MKAIEKVITYKYITFNEQDYNDPDNFYVINPVAILNLFTGVKWTVEKKPASYIPKAGDYVVECWKNGNYKHFARTNKGFNSLQVSNCVNKGKIDSYRVFRVVK